ncbi:MAG: hypothetical protein QM718_01290 [Steroidobacteraceae bacterium]
MIEIPRQAAWSAALALVLTAAVHAADTVSPNPVGGKPGNVNVDQPASEAAARTERKQSFKDSVRNAGHVVAEDSKKAAHSVARGARKVSNKIKQKVHARSGSRRTTPKAARQATPKPGTAASTPAQ